MTPRAMIWIFVSITVLMMGLMLIKPSYKSQVVFDKTFAEHDIKSGMVKLITFGLGGLRKESNVIASKYGFKEYNLGCIVSYTPGKK
jgi:energy-converting hydrogenase Eha subunit F